MTLNKPEDYSDDDLIRLIEVNESALKFQSDRRDDSIRQIETMRRDIRLLKEELKRRATPAEPGVGSFIRFDRYFSGSLTAYQYAAVHAADGRWHTTGNLHGTFSTWRDMLEFIRAGIRPGAADSLVRVVDTSANTDQVLALFVNVDPAKDNYPERGGWQSV